VYVQSLYELPETLLVLVVLLLSWMDEGAE
jgi:hypothetical protein